MQVREQEVQVCRQLQQQLLQELPHLQAASEEDQRLQGKLHLLASLLDPANYVCPISTADTCTLIRFLLTGLVLSASRYLPTFPLRLAKSGRQINHACHGRAWPAHLIHCQLQCQEVSVP